MILNSILHNNAQKIPDRIAVTMKMGYRTKHFTYAQVYDLAKQIALFMQANGVNKGDRVILLAPNSPYWVCIYWACLLQGVIVVPLTIQSTKAMVQRVIDQTQAKLFFKYLYYVQELPAITTIDVDFIEELVRQYRPEQFTPPALSTDDIMQIMYTSGTTGDPKGVIHTHKNMYASLLAVTTIVDIKNPAHERLLSILPLSHIYEQSMGFLAPFYFGMHIIYTHNPTAIGTLLQQYQITKMLAVPEFLHLLMGRIETQIAASHLKSIMQPLFNLCIKLNNRIIARLLLWPVRRKLGKLNIITSGGAPLNIELEKKWNGLGIWVLQGYGLTETSPLVSSNTYKQHRLGSQGQVVTEVHVRLAPDGEIWVKGPNVFQGYYKNVQKTQEAFSPDGWFMTGDIGEFDADQFLYIRGRKKYMIKGAGAQNVFPEDIETELNKLPGVVDSAVIGLDKHGTVEIHAVLLLDAQAQAPGTIINQANSHLASYQQITGWTIWPETDFPRSATRKAKKEIIIQHLKASDQPTIKSNLPVTPLVKIIAQVTGMPAHAIHTNSRLVTDLKLDSLMRVELVSRMQDELRVQVDETSINATTTVQELIEMADKREPVKQKQKMHSWPRSWWATGLRNLLAPLIYLMLRIFIKVEVTGAQNLAGDQYIFMPNHISYLDGLAIWLALPFAYKRTVTFAAAVDVLYAQYWYASALVELLFNAFPLPRKEYENISSGLENMGTLLDQGYSIIVFPEGQMSPDGNLLPLKRGTGIIATQMDTPIIPVKITGTSAIIPYDRLLPVKLGTVTVHFGPAIQFSKMESYIDVTDKIHDTIQKL